MVRVALGTGFVSLCAPWISVFVSCTPSETTWRWGSLTNNLAKSCSCGPARSSSGSAFVFWVDSFAPGETTGRDQQRKCWIDNVKEWTFLPIPELLMMAFRRKDWKGISAESSLSSPRRPNRSRDWTELDWTEGHRRPPVVIPAVACADWKIRVPLCRDFGTLKGSLFKAWREPEYCFACFIRWQKFCLPEDCLSDSFSFVFPNPSQAWTGLWHEQLLTLLHVIGWIAFLPDMDLRRLADFNLIPRIRSKYYCIKACLLVLLRSFCFRYLVSSNFAFILSLFELIGSLAWLPLNYVLFVRRLCSFAFDFSGHAQIFGSDAAKKPVHSHLQIPSSPKGFFRTCLAS